LLLVGCAKVDPPAEAARAPVEINLDGLESAVGGAVEGLLPVVDVPRLPEPLPAEVSDEVLVERSVEVHEVAAADTDAEKETVVIEPLDDLEIPLPSVAKVGVNTDTLMLFGTEVAAGTATQLAWSPGHTFEGLAQPTPVLVVRGAKSGPTLCLTAAVHGDELNGIEIVRRVMFDLDADKLEGTVLGVPIVNVQAFTRTSRYLPDRRDLNRFFPGTPTGSAASRIAYSFFTEIISRCTALVDLHTGSFHRTNLPQLRADLENPEVVRMTRGFGATVVLHSMGTPGTLRRAATDAGIPAVTLEAGGPSRLQEDEVEHGVKGVQTLLAELEMYKKRARWRSKEPVYYTSQWVRADHGGFLLSNVKLGRLVEEGEVLGVITDPITNQAKTVIAPVGGRILGMALNQVVMPGFAAYRIGTETESDATVPVEDVHDRMEPDDSLAAADIDEIMEDLAE
jgi:predicted deacylase